MFWPGSEAAIGGVSPTRWWPFDGSVPNEERVRRVLDWLSLPEGERPAFVSLYFQEVDHIGHVSGPDSPEVLEAAAHLDAALGQLLTGIDCLGLSDRVTIVVVSDHGMAPHTTIRWCFWIPRSSGDRECDRHRRVRCSSRRRRVASGTCRASTRSSAPCAPSCPT